MPLRRPSAAGISSVFPDCGECWSARVSFVLLRTNDLPEISGREGSPEAVAMTYPYLKHVKVRILLHMASLSFNFFVSETRKS